jgi:lysophospholipase L1-like esterase
MLVGTSFYFYFSKQSKPEDVITTLVPSIQEDLVKEEPEEIPEEDKQEPVNEEEKNPTNSGNNSKSDTELTIETEEIADIHIVGLGDSLTKGTGDPDKEGYIQSVASDIQKTLQKDVSVKNFGIKGYKSEQLVKKLEKEDVRRNLEYADYVFLSIGGNDILKIVEYNFFNLNVDLFETGEQEFKKNLFIIIQTIRLINPNANIFLVGLFNPFHNFFEDIEETDLVVQEWNRTIQTVSMINENTEFVPINDIFQNTEEQLFADDLLHPNDNGYQRIADRIQIYLDINDGTNIHIEE